MAEIDNNRTPVEVVRLFIETTTKLFEQNKDAIDHSTDEIKDLRDKITKTVNILNQNPSNAEIEDKLDGSIARTNTMITVVKVAVALVALCGILAVFGSQMLFRMNVHKELEKNNLVVREKSTDTEKKIDWLFEKFKELEMEDEIE